MEIGETVAMFRRVAQTMIDSTDQLTKADQAIGDGDHGIGMQRGFEAVQKTLEDSRFETVGDVLKQIGYGLMNSTGGASGAIFGTLFIGAARELKERKQFDAACLSLFLQSGLDAVKKRGRANLGDKTMVDALEPAAAASKNRTALTDCIDAASEAAQRGMEATKEMVANFGRAKSLGKRAVGHPDPGSISMSLILGSMREYIASNLSE